MCESAFKNSEKLDEFTKAMAEVQKEIRPAGKSGMNKFDDYDYAKEEDWYKAVRPSLDAHGLVLIFSCPVITPLENRKTAKGGVEYVRQASGALRILHVSGQWIEIYGYGEGQDRGDKATYKAITGMKKYLYSMGFAIPTTDDPETDSHKTVEATPQFVDAETRVKGAKSPKDLIAIAARVAQSDAFDNVEKDSLNGKIAEQMLLFAGNTAIKVKSADEVQKARSFYNGFTLFSDAQRKMVNDALDAKAKTFNAQAA